MRVVHVVGARPNFVKAGPVHRALARRGVEQVLVHTGQHYDARMSDVFFHELGLPEPDINLQVGSGTHAVQTAQVMTRLEPVILESRPDWVLVYGDVNSTVAAALVCAKLGVPVAHVEAGLRSFDRRMPEEINRLVTDQLADMLLTPSSDADENLQHEGIPAHRIRFVGNVMIDTLVDCLPAARERASRSGHPDTFALVTLHRPSNVDDDEILGALVTTLVRVSRTLPVIFPVHPRTRERLAGLAASADLGRASGVSLVEPLGYLDFLGLEQAATVVVTDSGGVQEETTYLGVPCLTLRENTERPVTITLGTNILLGHDVRELERIVPLIVGGDRKRGGIPPLWDGHAAERVADALGAIIPLRGDVAADTAAVPNTGAWTTEP